MLIVLPPKKEFIFAKNSENRCIYSWEKIDCFILGNTAHMSNTAAVMMTVNNDCSEGNRCNVQRQVSEVFSGERMTCYLRDMPEIPDCNGYSRLFPFRSVSGK